ncbi:MAG: hypothetical protein Q4F69_10525 [Bacteroidia bacterium]|nr:hypothetical protein [Bacteroidia bacterium]
MEAKSIKERLLDFIKYKGLTVKSFEKECGLSNGFVSKTGKSIREASLRQISLRFPELNLQWLEHGIDSMLTTPDGVSTPPSGKKYVFPPTTFDLDDPPASNMLDNDEYSAYVEFLRTSLLSLQEKYAALEATLAKKEAQIDILLNELKQKQNN